MLMLPVCCVRGTSPDRFVNNLEQAPTFVYLACPTSVPDYHPPKLARAHVSHLLLNATLVFVRDKHPPLGNAEIRNVRVAVPPLAAGAEVLAHQLLISQFADFGADLPDRADLTQVLSVEFVPAPPDVTVEIDTDA